ncbi:MULTISPECIES: anthranilate phosphoribosyltransferase family protein [Planktothrix]|jgi:anthranilate phosphoribosyltransferase|uniref:Glycosyl transferase n=2 Tax=Planktothrix agardhii TaxID=1160 RepID=A0A073CIP8_PLAA1|nr:MULTISPECIES: anthranilate phosphoribosyltransferase family protein [Planktothrix]MCF3606114.1 anthranilate phosphoribosyltransferase family protein [Planktothrix agardhii 1033]KEI68184.1 Glycosyl transferase [Planktothrix agardhii NIVA-CYA 126/8]MBG0746058.1 anthranilate phosphoribosyltransferase family protein [Planktothrix agardhii KL2]MCB8750212.1 anthranilate phosphoribosyltransferase family protein [Planktothrix agardhii 1810]MCB8758981.1 anthranilate phosphoribosyltransferase family 
MSDRFRDLLRQVGSGTHTSEALTRSQAAEAMRLMLLEEATPAQIGAFLIAHRIRRPTGEELAGMLDAYEEIGPQLQSVTSAPFVLGCPYDGRSRTAPMAPLTALILVTAGVQVILHGGQRMPTKEGIPLIEVWQGLGLDWSKLSLAQVQKVFAELGLGFVYLPQHFLAAEKLVSYRREIGKRPPLATMELIWKPYLGQATVVCGYVHPPTETMFREAFHWRGVTDFITVKGLEGSCDLPRDRTCIIGLHQPGQQTQIVKDPTKILTKNPILDDVFFERLLLHPRDYGFDGREVTLSSTPILIEQIQTVLKGQSSEFMKATLWNGGFYLWRSGVCQDLESGLSSVESLITEGKVQAKLQEIQNYFFNGDLK